MRTACLVVAEQRVEHGVATERGEVQRLARRGAADGVEPVAGELHVRHGFGESVEHHHPVPGGGADDGDAGHAFSSGTSAKVRALGVFEA